MKKLLIWSRVPYYNHCPCRFCYHCAKKYHPNRCPLSTLYLRQNLVCPPASRLYLKELLSILQTVSSCLKICHFPSFWKSLSSTKHTCTPTLSAIYTLTISDREQGSLNADVSENSLPFVSQSINNFSDYDISQSVYLECPSLSPHVLLIKVTSRSGTLPSMLSIFASLISMHNDHLKRLSSCHSKSMMLIKFKLLYF